MSWVFVSKVATKDSPISLLLFFLGEVHDVAGVHVNGDGPGHGCGRAVLGAAREVRAFAGVVLLLDQVVPGAESDQVGVVGRGRNGDGPGAADVRVAKLERDTWV